MVTRLLQHRRRQGPASFLERCEPGLPHSRVIEGFSRVCQGLRVCRESVASLWRDMSKGCARGCASFRESYGARRAAGRTPYASGGDSLWGLCGELREVCSECVRVSPRSSATHSGESCETHCGPLRYSPGTLAAFPTCVRGMRRFRRRFWPPGAQFAASGNPYPVLH
jgi:hypothetical protein